MNWEAQNPLRAQKTAEKQALMFIARQCRTSDSRGNINKRIVMIELVVGVCVELSQENVLTISAELGVCTDRQVGDTLLTWIKTWNHTNITSHNYNNHRLMPVYSHLLLLADIKLCQVVNYLYW